MEHGDCRSVDDVAEDVGVYRDWSRAVVLRLLLPLLAAVAACSAGLYHTVRPGENLYRIGKAYGVPYTELARVNGLENPDEISVGQLIYVPGARRQLPVSIITPRSANPARPRQSTSGPVATAAVAKRKPRAGAAARVPSPPSVTTALGAARRTTANPGPAGSVNAPSGKEVSEFGFSWPVKGTLTSTFGARRRGHHDGVDISASNGTVIRSASAGKVIFSDKLAGYGNVIIIEHDRGFTTVYAHNERNQVKKGDLVERGSRIGLVGRSGRASGSHLHFEIRKNNIARNPLHYLPPV